MDHSRISAISVKKREGGIDNYFSAVLEKSCHQVQDSLLEENIVIRPASIDDIHHKIQDSSAIHLAFGPDPLESNNSVFLDIENYVGTTVTDFIKYIYLRKYYAFFVNGRVAGFFEKFSLATVAHRSIDQCFKTLRQRWRDYYSLVRRLSCCCCTWRRKVFKDRRNIRNRVL